jgi:ribonuclease BN (tRNA processing enzyme)
VSLFIADATWPGDPPSRLPRYNLTAAEAGRYAAGAGAERLLLTHFWPGTDRTTSVAAARAHYDRDVMIADEGMTISVPPR